MGWRYIGSATTLASTTDAHLDTIVSLFASVTYASGAARVPGTGYAWSLQSQEGTPREAVALQGPTGCGHSARVLIAGHGVTVPNASAMAAPDNTGLASCLHVLTSVGGTLSGWSTATPMGAVRFNGYDRSGVVVTGAPGIMRAWESKKGIAIVYKNAAAWSGFKQGAWIRPWRVDGPLGAEADGHLYGGCVTGAGGTMSLDEDLSVYNQNFAQQHINSASRAHIHVLVPGGTALIYLLAEQLRNIYIGATPANRHKTRDGEWVRQPLEYRDYTDQAIGYGHDMGWVPNDMLGVTRYNGANPNYYTIAASDLAVGDAIGLYHNDVTG